jgi:S1-C subfamily serine protease
MRQQRRSARGRDRVRADAGDRKRSSSVVSRPVRQLRGDHLVVARVTPLSLAAADGVEAGMIVVDLNGTELYRLPANVYAEPSTDPDQPTADPNVGPEPIGVDPAV